MEQKIIGPWLAQVCVMLPGLQQASVVSAQSCLAAGSSAEGSLPALASFPQESETLVDAPWPSLGATAAQQRAPLVSIVDDADKPLLRIAYPMQTETESDLLLLCELASGPSRQQAILQVLAWGAAWLKLLHGSQNDPVAPSEERPVSKGNPIWPALGAALQTGNPGDSAYTLCVALKKILLAEQVCVFEQCDSGTQLLALSSSPDFDRRSILVQQLSALAGSASSSEPNGLISLAEAASTMTTLAPMEWKLLPLHHAQWRGSLLIAVNSEHGLPPSDQNDLLELAPALSALIALRQSETTDLRALLRRMGHHLHPLKARRAGRNWPLFATGALCLLLVLGLWQSPYRISAPVKIEALHQRSLVAPFEGFVALAHKRAGEAVEAGELIATLDDRSLKLERQRWLGQIDEYRKQSRQAMANREQAQARIIAAQLAQAEAQLKLVEARLQRTEVRAPIAGMIVEGDLSRALDAPVKQGQILFQIAPLDAYRAVFKIAEKDMALVAIGQSAAIRLKAFPQQEWTMTLSERALVYEEDANGAWYRAEAPLEAETARLRPGMEGQGKIEVGDRSLLWQGLRGFVNWWRMALWRWWP